MMQLGRDLDLTLDAVRSATAAVSRSEDNVMASPRVQDTGQTT